MGVGMQCEKLRQEFMEVVLNGMQGASVETQEHLRSCPACRAELASLQQTMSLLDEWQAPEPSPYFATRLQAQIREEALSPRWDWFAWVRRPALAAAAAVLIAVGVGLLEMNPFHDNNTVANKDGSVVRVNGSTSAVTDLQYLDKNGDLFADFDALDGQSSTE
jgi:predicted anti-sigma-YlaC factor YlaD